MATTGAALDLLTSADAAMRARDYPAAISLLKQHCARGAPAPSDFLRLAAALRGSGDFVGGLDAAGNALRIDPYNYMALLMRGSLLVALGRNEEAAKAYEAAIFNAPDEAALPRPLIAELGRAREHVAAIKAWRNALLESSADALDVRRSARLERFRTNILRETRTHHQAPTDFDFPGLPTIEFFDGVHFDGLDELGAATPVILAEFHALIAANAAELAPYVQYSDDMPVAQWAELNHSRKWSAIHLYRNGARVEQNCALCPETMRLYERLDIPAVGGRSPNLMFSLLDPHTRIPSHTGVSNTRVVMHLPLIIPPGCGFRVGGETRQWKTGEPFVFDDTIEHEAWNDSDHLRVVLIGDLWRPELSEDERTGVRAYMQTNLATAGAGL